MSLKSVYLDLLTWRKYGSTRPESVVPPGSPSPVFINPHDRRALKKLAHDSARGRVSVPMRFWRDAIAAVSPHLAIDVGANYGECFSSLVYPSDTRVLAIEANPALIPFLEKSRAAHPSAPAVRIVNCLVSDSPGPAQPFYFDPNWTGGGSAVTPAIRVGLTEVNVAVNCLDQIIEPDTRMDDIVFKADIEGYEGRLFRGFSRLFSCRRVAGIFEFDTALTAKSGVPPRDVFDKLAARFLMFDTRRHTKTLRPLKDWSALTSSRGEAGDFHTDLVFVTSQSELPAGWSVIR
jgi:FkbM family methyltransferase